MKRELNKTIGLRVKRAREAAGLTQERLAELIDRSKEAVSNIERGVSLPGLDTIQTICDVTKVPMTSIVEDSGEDVSTADLRATLNAVFSQLSLSNKRLVVALTETIMSQSTRNES
ncbi:XRE family transcriptional regulator [Methylobacterium sp. P1-11]|nr:XRE family transcriptional regulator [Methylobacterium sp. P1-11]